MRTIPTTFEIRVAGRVVATGEGSPALMADISAEHLDGVLTLVDDYRSVAVACPATATAIEAEWSLSERESDEQAARWAAEDRARQAERYHAYIAHERHRDAMEGWR